MSPFVITLLVVGAIVLLLILAFINKSIENNKLEKARQKANLTDRIRRCQEVCARLPGQFLDSKLLLTLTKIEMQLCARLLFLEKNNAKLKARIEMLRAEITNSASAPKSAAPQMIASEAKAKEVRHTLEDLLALITYCVQNQLMPATEGKEWLKRIQHMLVQLYIDFFNAQAQLALQSGTPGQARLAYERAVLYLRKQPNKMAYQAQLAQFEQLLAQANAQVLSATDPVSGAPAKLSSAMANVVEDEWKKKTLYD